MPNFLRPVIAVAVGVLTFIAVHSTIGEDDDTSVIDDQGTEPIEVVDLSDTETE